MAEWTTDRDRTSLRQVRPCPAYPKRHWSSQLQYDPLRCTCRPGLTAGQVRLPAVDRRSRYLFTPLLCRIGSSSEAFQLISPLSCSQCTRSAVVAGSLGSLLLVQSEPSLLDFEAQPCHAEPVSTLICERWASHLPISATPRTYSSLDFGHAATGLLESCASSRPTSPFVFAEKRTCCGGCCPAFATWWMSCVDRC